MSSDLQNVADEIDFFALALKSINAGAPGLSIGIREHMARSIALKCRDAVRTAALRSPGLDRDGERMRVLVSQDGALSCVPHEAIEVAYLMNTAEAVILNAADEIDARHNIGDVLTTYAAGDCTLAEAMQEIRDEGTENHKVDPLPLAHEEKAGC